MRRYGNVIVVATEGALPSQDALRRQLGAPARGRRRGRSICGRAIEHRWEQPVPFDDVPLLTDGYAPTDALLVD